MNFMTSKGGMKGHQFPNRTPGYPWYLSSFGLPPPATEHRIESIQQDEGEERHQNESWFFPLLFGLTLVVTLCSFTEIFGIATKKPTSVSFNPCGCILVNTGKKHIVSQSSAKRFTNHHETLFLYGKAGLSVVTPLFAPG